MKISVVLAPVVIEEVLEVLAPSVSVVVFVLPQAARGVSISAGK